MTRFSELDDFVAIPAVTSLSLAPDGSWLAASVQTLGAEPKKYASSIWRIGTDPAKDVSAVRLTRSGEGESGQRFLPDGSLLFMSSRPEPGVKPDSGGDGAKTALWLLPPGGGEARRVCAPPGGAGSMAVARAAASYLLAAPAFPGTDGFDADAERRKARTDAGVRAILHDGEAMIRYWDQDLGPDYVRLLAGSDTAEGADPGQVRDLTPEAGSALGDQEFDLSPDGSIAVTGWAIQIGAGALRNEVVVLDVVSGARRTLLGADGTDFIAPLVSPDGRLVLAIRHDHDSYQRPGQVTLVTAPLDGAEQTAGDDLLAGFDRQPLAAQWGQDSDTIYFTTDDNGRRPVYAVRLSSGEVAKVTTDDAAYESLCPSQDGQYLYALRSAISEPPAPVRIDLAVPGSEPVRLLSPAGEPPELPGRVEEVTATAADGTALRGWLALPAGASADAKAPLLLWVHGGPVMSWNAWSFRWNPWLMVAKGYAVLLPDPALSTGYGHDFIARGHGTWGQAPFTDVMTITDAVVARSDIDETRTAMMGGSFGGYMANWIAGHTTRFRAIVSHAGLWALDQMFGTTDGPSFWRREFGHPVTEPERYLANSPHLHADQIATPMLLIHGDKDYRVPIGEALRMYAELTSLGKNVKFLYFPDENHWILKPGHAKVWYSTVFAFLAENVLDEKWERPALV